MRVGGGSLLRRRREIRGILARALDGPNKILSIGSEQIDRILRSRIPRQAVERTSARAERALTEVGLCTMALRVECYQLDPAGDPRDEANVALPGERSQVILGGIGRAKSQRSGDLRSCGRDSLLGHKPLNERENSCLTGG